VNSACVGQRGSAGEEMERSGGGDGGSGAEESGVG